eukprot:6342380-Amphidinium_carterae.1
MVHATIPSDARAVAKSSPYHLGSALTKSEGVALFQLSKFAHDFELPSSSSSHLFPSAHIFAWTLPKELLPTSTVTNS